MQSNISFELLEYVLRVWEVLGSDEAVCHASDFSLNYGIGAQTFTPDTLNTKLEFCLPRCLVSKQLDKFYISLTVQFFTIQRLIDQHNALHYHFNMY
jgi:hypothetical protein